jgi:hypothetical protein
MTRRPRPTEYHESYRGYVDLVPNGDLVSILRAQIEESTGLLDRVPADRLDYRYAPGKWSLREVVGHVVDMEWVFTSRALCFARKLGAPLPGVEQDDFMAAAKFATQPWPSLLSEWRHLRAANSLLFETFDDDTLNRSGVASGYDVTVRAIPFIIAGHERHHMGVIRERYLR